MQSYCYLLPCREHGETCRSRTPKFNDAAGKAAEPAEGARVQALEVLGVGFKRVCSDAFGRFVPSDFRLRILMLQVDGIAVSG